MQQKLLKASKLFFIFMLLLVAIKANSQAIVAKKSVSQANTPPKKKKKKKASTPKTTNSYREISFDTGKPPEYYTKKPQPTSNEAPTKSKAKKAKSLAAALEGAQDTVFMDVDTPPQYQGGEDSLRAFLARNANFPKSAREIGAEGTIWVEFMVRPNGDIQSPRIINKLHPDCDAEAIRLIRLMPAWVPGSQAGRIVSVLTKIPITFQFID